MHGSFFVLISCAPKLEVAASILGAWMGVIVAFWLDGSAKGHSF